MLQKVQVSGTNNDVCRGWGDWKKEKKGLQNKKQNHLKPPEPKQISIIDSTIVIMFPI